MFEAPFKTKLKVFLKGIMLNRIENKKADWYFRFSKEKVLEIS